MARKPAAKPTISFSRRPNSADCQFKWEILRVPKSGLNNVIVLSDDVEGSYTHWINGRTMPCGNERCTWCEAFEQRRWYGYLGVSTPDGAARRLLEITMNAVPYIDAYLTNRSSLRGARLQLSRLANRPMGKLFCKVTDSGLPMGGFPTGPDVQALLAKMWGVNFLRASQPQEDRDQRAMKIADSKEIA
jgi:hypothetical protein